MSFRSIDNVEKIDYLRFNLSTPSPVKIFCDHSVITDHACDHGCDHAFCLDHAFRLA